MNVGRIVHYRPSELDSEELRGNLIGESDVLPAIVVRDWGGCFNLKIFTDGPIDVWKTSVLEGDAPGTWHWPVRT